MDSLLNTQNLSVFLVFFVPGIIILYVRSLFLNGRRPALAEGVIAYVTISLIYHALAYPFATPLYIGPETSTVQRREWFLMLFVIPIIIGGFLGWMTQRGWGRRILSKSGLNLIHPVDNAWDWKFSNCEECWVIAMLKDGTRWAGYLGTNSFMSSIATERDIYIEAVYEITKKDEWIDRETSVWLAHGEIQSLEFFPKKI